MKERWPKTTLILLLLKVCKCLYWSFQPTLSTRHFNVKQGPVSTCVSSTQSSLEPDWLLTFNSSAVTILGRRFKGQIWHIHWDFPPGISFIFAIMTFGTRSVSQWHVSTADIYPQGGEHHLKTSFFIWVGNYELNSPLTGYNEMVLWIPAITFAFGITEITGPTWNWSTPLGRNTAQQGTISQRTDLHKSTQQVHTYI